MNDTTTWAPGTAPAMAGLDGSTGRCGTCDSRRCPYGRCAGREGYVYASGLGGGWVSPERAKALEAQGATVEWDRPFHVNEYR